MRIRDLKWKGLSAWPPEWWISDEGAGEEGFLKNVQLRYDRTSACITVLATHLNENRTALFSWKIPPTLKFFAGNLEKTLAGRFQK